MNRIKRTPLKNFSDFHICIMKSERKWMKWNGTEWNGRQVRGKGNGPPSPWSQFTVYHRRLCAKTQRSSIVCIMQNLPNASQCICTNHKILWASILRIIMNECVIHRERIWCWCSSGCAHRANWLFRSHFRDASGVWKLLLVGSNSIVAGIVVLRVVTVSLCICLIVLSRCLGASSAQLCIESGNCEAVCAPAVLPFRRKSRTVSPKQMNIWIKSNIRTRAHATITHRTTSC